VILAARAVDDQASRVVDRFLQLRCMPALKPHAAFPPRRSLAQLAHDRRSSCALSRKSSTDETSVTVGVSRLFKA
jgi:hypothetical protein